MTNQLSKQVAQWYREIEAEWRESLEDQRITLAEAMSLAQSATAGELVVFDEDYRKLAVASLEVSD